MGSDESQELTLDQYKQMLSESKLFPKIEDLDEVINELRSFLKIKEKEDLKDNAINIQKTKKDDYTSRKSEGKVISI